MAPTRLSIITTVVFIRLLIALATCTFFQPDEFFQSLEVAHHAVFGYGHVTWEWVSKAPIRSPIYPALYIPEYALLKLLWLDETSLLIQLPKIANGLVACLTDFGLYILTEQVLGHRYVNIVMLLSLTSFFNALSLTRSLSNAFETSLTTMAFSFFPWDPAIWTRRKTIMCLFYAALACCIRPTNAVIWAYAFLVLLYHMRSRPDAVKTIVLDALFIGGVSSASLFVVDSIYYGEVTLTPLNFLKTNLRVSSFYGTNEWHFYLTQALPLLCTTALPFVLHGAYLAHQQRNGSSTALYAMLGVTVWTIAVYSLGSHKEWRFLHPLLPLLHVFAAKSLVDLNDGYAKYDASLINTPSKGHPGKRETKAKPLIPIRRTHLCFLLLNIPLMYYVMRWHGSAQISVMHYLRSVPAHELDSLGFLMPCHSTPWQAYLHRSNLEDPGRMWAIGCEPPPEGEDVKLYKDQTDVFYNDPLEYIRTRFPALVDPSFPPSPYPATKPGALVLKNKHGKLMWAHTWPRYLVMFGSLLEVSGMKEALVIHGYREVWMGVNGFEEDPRRRGGVQVWKWTQMH